MLSRSLSDCQSLILSFSICHWITKSLSMSLSLSLSDKSINQKGQMCLRQLCGALKTLESKGHWLIDWVSDKVLHWTVLDACLPIVDEYVHKYTCWHMCFIHVQAHVQYTCIILDLLEDQNLKLRLAEKSTWDAVNVVKNAFQTNSCAVVQNVLAKILIITILFYFSSFYCGLMITFLFFCGRNRCQFWF